MELFNKSDDPVNICIVIMIFQLKRTDSVTTADFHCSDFAGVFHGNYSTVIESLTN